MSIKSNIKGFTEILQFSNRFELLVNKFFNPKQDLQIYKYGNLEILTSKKAYDISAFRSVFIRNEYFEYLNFLKDQKINNLLDCGANIGTFSMILNKLNFDIKKLVCVEYNPNTFQRLKFNIDFNLKSDTVCLNAAVVEKDKTLKLKISEGGSGEGIYKEIKNGKEIELEGITINTLYKRYFINEIIDLAKIDIEGAEYEIFESDDLSFLDKIRFIIIEIHRFPGMEPEKVKQKLKDNNFELVDIPKSRNNNLYLFKNNSY